MTEELGGFIPMPDNFEDIEMPRPVASGMYDLRIVAAELRKDEMGALQKCDGDGEEIMFNIRIEFVESPDTPGIFHNLMMSTNASKAFTKAMQKKFLESFGIDPFAIDPEGRCFIGATWSQAKVKYVAAKGQFRERNELDL